MHFGNRSLQWGRAGALLALLAVVPLFAGGGPAGAAPSGPRTLSVESVPPAVRNGQAKPVGPHAAADSLHVLFNLPMHDKAGMDAFLADVNNPHSAHYGQYLTLEQANARFNPTVAGEQRVLAWLKAEGINDVQTQPNHLYVGAQVSAATLNRLLGIQITDYTLAGRTIYAPDRAPTLPAAVSSDVDWVVGLSNATRFHTMNNGTAHGTAPYYAQDYANAYNVTPLWNAGYTGAGTTVAITLWGAAPSDTALNNWHSRTGAAVATRANGRLVIIPVDGGSTFADVGEAGMDIEASGGIAYQAQIRYYEAPTDANGNPTTLSSLTDTLNAAGTDPVNNRQISNSWGGDEDADALNAFDPVFAANAATGHTYLFSSGDSGSASGFGNGDPVPSYPATSAYVVAVGGTRFSGNIGASWPGEVAWLYTPSGSRGPEGSGGGYSTLVSRPSWQVAPGFANSQRGYPDVSAVGDPATGYQVCYGNGTSCAQIGGTSLSSPLWGGILAITNQYLLAQGQPGLGFAAPSLYQLANSAQTYPPYHDITSGTNGAYATGAGWDAVTGLGSPDVWNIARDLSGGAPPTATPQATPTNVAGQIFTDVPPSNTFYTPINWIYNHGIVSGYSNSDGSLSFRPTANATRGQVCKIITLATGWAIDTSGGPHFSDIAGTTFYNYIETAYHHGVISGYSDGTFRPSATTSRAQFAKVVVLARAWATDTTGGPHFTDIAPGSTFYTVIETAYNHGIISGYTCGASGEPCPGTYFRPSVVVSRGQLSKLIYLSYGP
ncbi:MAG: S-layer homology domain-containing protein [Chloroflexota bacterium]|nr:S-layer homology domain-containing protein [Chloroflexota bacterium]